MTREEKTMLYTARWYTRERWGEPSAKQEVLDILGNFLISSRRQSTVPRYLSRGKGFFGVLLQAPTFLGRGLLEVIAMDTQKERSCTLPLVGEMVWPTASTIN